MRADQRGDGDGEQHGEIQPSREHREGGRHGVPRQYQEDRLPKVVERPDHVGHLAPGHHVEDCPPQHTDLDEAVCPDQDCNGAAGGGWMAAHRGRRQQTWRGWPDRHSCLSTGSDGLAAGRSGHSRCSGTFGPAAPPHISCSTQPIPAVAAEASLAVTAVAAGGGPTAGRPA